MSKDDLGGHPTKDNSSCQRVQDVVMIGQDERVRGCDPEKEGSTVDCDRHVFCNHCGYKRSILFPASLVHCIQTVQCPIVCQSRINSENIHHFTYQTGTCVKRKSSPIQKIIACATVMDASGSGSHAGDDSALASVICQIPGPKQPNKSVSWNCPTMIRLPLFCNHLP